MKIASVHTLLSVCGMDWNKLYPWRKNVRLQHCCRIFQTSVECLQACLCLSGSLWSTSLWNLIVHCALRYAQKLHFLHSWKVTLFKQMCGQKQFSLYCWTGVSKKVSKGNDKSVWFDKSWRDRKGWYLMLPVSLISNCQISSDQTVRGSWGAKSCMIFL